MPVPSTAQHFREMLTHKRLSSLVTVWLWHRRYGHLHYASLSQLSSQEMVKGMTKVGKISDSCMKCINSNQPWTSFPSTLLKGPLEHWN